MLLGGWTSWWVEDVGGAGDDMMGDSNGMGLAVLRRLGIKQRSATVLDVLQKD